jgi:2-polyprenyl-3-methyl-5-hydroxy-6-metoxy-1,4-benzoquinol methylase
MILNETQLDRDKELAAILSIPVEKVQEKGLATPDSIRIFAGATLPEGDLTYLYEHFDSLDLVGYLRTLMKTSVTSRGKDLINLLKTTKNKNCLDYGCGVGTHSIALLENQNKVSVVDVKGPLINCALERIKRRNFKVEKSYYSEEPLPYNYFDLIICTDVLEHVADPIYVLGKMTRSLQRGGRMYLRVSTMIKPSSGHFPRSINMWKAESPKYLESHYKKVGSFLYEKL